MSSHSLPKSLVESLTPGQRNALRILLVDDRESIFHELGLIDYDRGAVLKARLAEVCQ
jgi:hypothetical protein